MQNPGEPEPQFMGLDASSSARSSDVQNTPAQQLLITLESISDAFFSLDHDWRFTYLNPQATNLLNQRSEDLIGKKIWEAFPEAVGTVFEQEYRRAIADQMTASFESFYPPLNAWYSVRAYPTPSGLAVYFQNVTERKQTEANLAQTNSILRSVVDGTADVVFVKDLHGRYVVANPAAAKWLDTTVEAMLGQTDLELFPSEAFQRIQQIDRQVMETGDSIVYEGAVPKQGTLRSLLTAKYPWRDADGTILGVIGISRDISDRKQNEEVLRRSEERYRSPFELIDEGFCIIEMLFDEHDRPIDYRFLEINPAFARHTGLEQALGKTARQLLPNLEEHWFEIYGNVALTGEPYRFEQGSEVMNRWFDVFAFRFGQPEQRKVAIRFKDISERVRAEAERDRVLERERVARTEAEQANRIKDEFLAVLSHELRSPLNPILGWTKLLQSGRLDAAKTEEALSTIERNAKLQSQLIEDLLDISRIMRGKLSLNSEPTDLALVISAAAETVRLAAEAKQIQIEMSLASKVPLISGDPGRLQQVVWNLLSNAVKFTPDHGRIDIQLTQVGHQARLQVIDTGKGIAPGFLPFVFEYFRQEDGSTTRKFGGLGLGLAIARQIVEMHGGTISASSAGEGKGCTFTVRLPLLHSAHSDPVRSLNATASSPEDLTPLVGIRALIVDDDADARELLTFLLEVNGAIVTTADSAVQALHLIEQSRPDILLSDIGMPDMDGYTLLRTIRQSEQNRSIPAIALTAYAGDLDRQQAIQVGFHHHVTKPIDPDTVTAIVLKLAGKQKTS
jgi:PAS domain S-box-containing protein